MSQFSRLYRRIAIPVTNTNLFAQFHRWHAIHQQSSTSIISFVHGDPVASLIYTTNTSFIRKNKENDEAGSERIDCEQSLIFLCKVTARNLSTRAAKPLAARNEGVSPRRKNKSSPSFLVSSQFLYNNIVVCNRAG